jgi:formate dehydrogenase subunit gamma
MSKTIERFSTWQRVLHWFVTVSFFTLVLSGLGLYARLFHGYFNLFGGGRNAIFVHKIAGVLFFASSLFLFLVMRRDTTSFDSGDLAWFKSAGGYLTRKEMTFEVGKFNPGQKIFAIFTGAATVVLGITGVIIWMPLVFPRFLVQFSLMLHGLMFVCAIMFVLVHVYLGTIGNPGTLESMLWGNVRKNWARHHHPRWYREKMKSEG